ncbi:MAG: Sec-independent protein translocase protein TatB [Hyphomonadaceae bacterium]
MLPQFGFTEFMLLAIVALVVVGPKDLPVMMRRLGQFVAKGRAMANEFRAAFDDIARQAELDELRQEIEDLKNTNAVKEATDEMRNFERDVNDEVMRKTSADAQSKATPSKDSKSDAEPEAGS